MVVDKTTKNFLFIQFLMQTQKQGKTQGETEESNKKFINYLR